MKKIYKQDVKDNEKLEETYSKIDKIVFKLYNLTLEQIKVVEGVNDWNES